MTRALPARRAEQITATVLFVDLVGFTRFSAASGTEAAYLAATHLLRLLDGIARKHGGSVDKYLGDKLLAIFGHPVPLERPAWSAAAAALEMRQRVREYNREAALPVPFGIHIGINTGEIVSGDIRGPVVREFHVLGDAVNTAARINARAPDGSIWCGPRVYDETKSDFEWETLEPLTLKGKSRPVPVFALEAHLEAAGRDRLGFDERLLEALVGRGEELSNLRARAGSLVTGRGGVVLLTGPEGVGKSRLLGALGESDETRGIESLQTIASPLNPGHAGSAIAPLLDRIRETVGGRGAAAATGSAGLIDALRSQLTALVSEKPLLVVIEDVQWMDATSIAALEQALPLSREAPILFLLTARPGAVPERLRRDPVGRWEAETIELGPLEPDAARALVSAALGDTADPETTDLVLRRGGSLPGSLLRAAFLAPALRSEQEQGQQREERSTEAERRRAAVVFADLTGFTAMTEQVGAERAYPVIAACLEILDEVAREYGGTVDHYLGDCVMALFGVPRAIEDAPRAALNAAIEMRRRVRAFNDAHELPLPVDVHTGVATGLGIAGDISGPMIREFAVMGDHVDRADQLTHLAEAGEIRIDDSTRRATRDVFEFSRSESVVLPGASTPQPTWDLLSTAPELHRARVGAERQVFSALVGRDVQLERMRETLTRLAEGDGGVVSISAEAGIGKSRLLTELRSLEEARAARWLEGRALSNGRNLRYHPIADLLRSWAAVVDEDDERSIRKKIDDVVAAVLPDDVRDTAPLIANLMGARLSDEEVQQIGAIQGDAAEKIVRGAFVRMLRASSARQPLVIVMEDLHWADLSTVELVESLLSLAEEHPILFVNAFRPGFESTSGRVLAVTREQQATRHLELVLEPLDASAARTMVKNLFRGGDVPQKTRATIEERARGNPFYIEEVVRSLVDVGAVEIRAGSFHATEKLDSVVIPDTVQEAVMARVDRLGLEQRSVIQAASAIGGNFHLDVLEEMIELPGLTEILGQLESGEFIVPSDRTAGIEYAFKHPLIQEVTYDSLLESRRRELHLAVANATERRLSEAIPGYCAMLAYHFSKGDAAERAEDYLFRAGDEAARAAASNEALYFFQEASALYQDLHPDGGDPAKRARLEKSLAIALLNRGRLIESVDHFDATAKLLGHSSPRGVVTMGVSFALNLLQLLGRLYLGRPYGRRAATDRQRELIDVMFRRAIAQSTTNPVQFFVDSTALVRTLARFDPHSVPESAAIFCGVVAVFSFGGISFDVSRRFLAVARELAESGAVNERILYYRALRFLHHLLAGDWSEEHTIDPALVEEGIREGRFWEASTYLDLDCFRQIHQGNFAAAWDRIGKLAELVDLYQYDLASSARLFNTASLHVERREFDEALRALESYYDEHSEVLFNVLGLGTRARVYALRGDLEQAKAEVVRGEAKMKEAGRVPPFHASSVFSARYLVDVLELERAAGAADGTARAAARRARSSRKVALTTARKAPWRRPEVLRLAGREAWLRQRPTEALSWWERALACAQELGARPEFARTLADAGRAMAQADNGLRLGDRDASECLAEAREIFEDLALAADLSQISAAA